MAGNSNSGRKKKTPARHELDTGKKRPRAKAAAGTPVKPDGLSNVEDSLWDFLSPLLGADAGKSDSIALQALCEFWGLYRDAVEIAKEHPLDKDARIAVTSYWSAFERLAAKFGLTPTDRQRLDKSPPDEPDGLALFTAEEEGAA